LRYSDWVQQTAPKWKPPLFFSPDGLDNSSEIRAILLCVFLLALRLWISPLPSSFWLDETGTVWVIQGTLKDVWRHLGITDFIQMPLFSLLMWLWTRLTGVSEAALRLPSVIMMAGAYVLLYRIGRIWFGDTAAAYALVLLFSLSPFSYAAADARPYSYAMLCVVWSFYEIGEWTRTGRLRHLILHGIASGIMVHFSYFFGAALIAQVLYLFVAWQRRWIRLQPSLVISPLIAGAIVMPLVPTVMLLAGARQNALHIVATKPSWTDLGLAWVPPRWVVASVFGTVLMIPLRQRLSIAASPDWRKLALVLSWALVPTFVLFVYSLVGSGSVFVPRYLLSQAPGLALLGGYIVSVLRPVAWRGAIAASLSAITLASSGFALRTNHYVEDWRGALAKVRELRSAYPTAPVLAASSFVESVRLPMPPTGEQTEWMLSPLLAYPAGGPVTMLPFEVNGLNQSYFESVCAQVSTAGRIIALIPANTLLVQWIQGRFADRFSIKTINSNPIVLLFEKRGEMQK